MKFLHVYIIGDRETAVLEDQLKKLFEKYIDVVLQIKKLAGVYPLITGTLDYDIVSFNQLYGREPLPGEIGCALAHRHVWNQMVEDNALNAIVLEDDAELVIRDGSVLLSFIESFGELNVPAITLLGHSKVSKALWKTHLLRFKFVSIQRFGVVRVGCSADASMNGTVAYAINLIGAKKLSRLKMFFLADDYTIFHNVGLYVAHSLGAFFLESGVNSSIESKRDMHPSFIRYFIDSMRYFIISRVKFFLFKKYYISKSGAHRIKLK